MFKVLAVLSALLVAAITVVAESHTVHFNNKCVLSFALLTMI